MYHEQDQIFVHDDDQIDTRILHLTISAAEGTTIFYVLLITNVMYYTSVSFIYWCIACLKMVEFRRNM